MTKRFQIIGGIVCGSIAAFLAIALCGCAGFGTYQIDRTFGPGGRPKDNLLTETITKVDAHTVWDAKSELAKFKALQTAKTQSTAVGALNAQSSSTNIVQLMNDLARIAAASQGIPLPPLSQ